MEAAAAVTRGAPNGTPDTGAGATPPPLPPKLPPKPKLVLKAPPPPLPPTRRRRGLSSAKESHDEPAPPAVLFGPDGDHPTPEAVADALVSMWMLHVATFVGQEPPITATEVADPHTSSVAWVAFEAVGALFVRNVVQCIVDSRAASASRITFWITVGHHLLARHAFHPLYLIHTALKHPTVAGDDAWHHLSVVDAGRHAAFRSLCMPHNAFARYRYRLLICQDARCAHIPLILRRPVVYHLRHDVDVWEGYMMEYATQCEARLDQQGRRIVSWASRNDPTLPSLAELSKMDTYSSDDVGDSFSTDVVESDVPTTTDEATGSSVEAEEGQVPNVSEDEVTVWMGPDASWQPVIRSGEEKRGAKRRFKRLLSTSRKVLSVSAASAPTTSATSSGTSTRRRRSSFLSSGRKRQDDTGNAMDNGTTSSSEPRTCLFPITDERHSFAALAKDGDSGLPAPSASLPPSIASSSSNSMDRATFWASFGALTLPEAHVALARCMCLWDCSAMRQVASRARNRVELYEMVRQHEHQCATWMLREILNSPCIGLDPRVVCSALCSVLRPLFQLGNWLRMRCIARALLHPALALIVDTSAAIDPAMLSHAARLCHTACQPGSEHYTAWAAIVNVVSPAHASAKEAGVDAAAASPRKKEAGDGDGGADSSGPSTAAGATATSAEDIPISMLPLLDAVPTQPGPNETEATVADAALEEGVLLKPLARGLSFCCDRTEKYLMPWTPLEWHRCSRFRDDTSLPGLGVTQLWTMAHRCLWWSRGDDGVTACVRATAAVDPASSGSIKWLQARDEADAITPSCSFLCVMHAPAEADAEHVGAALQLPAPDDDVDDLGMGEMQGLASPRPRAASMDNGVDAIPLLDVDDPGVVAAEPGHVEWNRAWAEFSDIVPQLHGFMESVAGCVTVFQRMSATCAAALGEVQMLTAGVPVLDSLACAAPNPDVQRVLRQQIEQCADLETQCSATSVLLSGLSEPIVEQADGLRRLFQHFSDQHHAYSKLSQCQKKKAKLLHAQYHTAHLLYRYRQARQALLEETSVFLSQCRDILLPSFASLVNHLYTWSSPAMSAALQPLRQRLDEVQASLADAKVSHPRLSASLETALSDPLVIPYLRAYLTTNLSQELALAWEDLMHWDAAVLALRRAEERCDVEEVQACREACIARKKAFFAMFILPNAPRQVNITGVTTQGAIVHAEDDFVHEDLFSAVREELMHAIAMQWPAFASSAYARHLMYRVAPLRVTNAAAMKARTALQYHGNHSSV